MVIILEYKRDSHHLGRSELANHIRGFTSALNDVETIIITIDCIEVWKAFEQL